jgi:hypothetical protein
MWLSQFWRREPITQAEAVGIAVRFLRRRGQSVAEPPDVPPLPTDDRSYVYGSNLDAGRDAWIVVFTSHLTWNRVEPPWTAVIRVGRRTGRAKALTFF